MFRTGRPPVKSFSDYTIDDVGRQWHTKSGTRRVTLEVRELCGTGGRRDEVLPLGEYCRRPASVKRAGRLLRMEPEPD